MRRYMILACLLAIPLIVTAKVDMDYTVFRYDATLVDWEIFYSLPRTLLTYAPSAGGSSATAILDLKIIQNSAVWKELTWQLNDVVPTDQPGKKEMSIIDRAKVLAPPGTYSVKFYIKDPANPSWIDSTSFAAEVRAISATDLAISDLEFAGAIEKNSPDTNNPFYKNTLKVVPNPSRVFGKDHGPLQFYIETYNLMTLPGETYIVRYSISDNSGKLKYRKALPRKKKVDSSVEFATIPVDTLVSGAYTLKFSLADTSGKDQVLRQDKFFVYNKDLMAAGAPSDNETMAVALSSELGALDEKAIDQEFRYTGYLTTLEEKQIFKTIKELEAKRNYLYAVWKAKDRLGDVSKFRQEYLARIKYSNDHFSAMKKEGWQTDRGRVYILYGQPSYINRNPNTEGLRPYETWDYNELQGGVIFVFADFSGFKDYQLLHSNLIGEVHYENYMERIKRGY
jgi:GWxTD domain-containing protein